MIAAGEESDVIGKIFNGKKVGTLFLPENASSITAAITTTMNELLVSGSNNNNDNNSSNGLKTSSSLTALLQLPTSSATTKSIVEVNNDNSSNSMTVESIEELAKTVRRNSRILQSLSSQERTNILLKIVEYLHDRSELILHANTKDMEKAEKK